MAEFEAVAPLLLSSGTGALGWWRITHSPLPLPRELWNSLSSVRRAYGLQCAIRERQLGCILRFCESLCFTPILIKGWAISRVYADCNLRPMGDVDLCIAPEHAYELKRKVSADLALDCTIDFDHTEITRFANRGFEDLYEHSIRETVDGTCVRLLCPEDNLRILCLHALKHGVWRPLWLCDIAAALESRSEKFNWDRCLGPDRKQAHWVICALALAGELLGAEVAGTPANEECSSLPGWMVTAVLERWNSCRSPVLPQFTVQMRDAGGDLRAIFELLKSRWPNPIQATVDCNGAFAEGSRWPFQVWNLAQRGWKIVKESPQFGGRFRHEVRTPTA